MDSRVVERTLLDLSSRVTELNRRVMDLEDENANLKGKVEALEAEDRGTRRDTDAQVTSTSGGHQGELADEVASLKLSLASVRSDLARHLGGRRDERYYQKLLEKELGGGHMHIAGVGTTDITTADAHIEIKHWNEADRVLGQLAKYTAAVFRAKRVVYFFGQKPHTKRIDVIFNIMREARIEMWHIDSDDSLHLHRVANPGHSPLRNDVQDFIRNHLTPARDPRKVLEWKLVHQRYKSVQSYTKAKAPILQEELRLHGLHWYSGSENKVKFDGFRGWELKPSQPRDTQAE